MFLFISSLESFLLNLLPSTEYLFLTSGKTEQKSSILTTSLGQPPLPNAGAPPCGGPRPLRSPARGLLGDSEPWPALTTGSAGACGAVGGGRLGLLSRCRHRRCRGLLLQGGLLSQQLLLVQARGQLLLLLLLRLVEVLHQLRLRASLRHHRELGDGWLLGGCVYCLKLSRRSGKKDEGNTVSQNGIPQTTNLSGITKPSLKPKARAGRSLLAWPQFWRGTSGH